MSSRNALNDQKTILVYSLNPWDNALPVLRVRGPAEQAGYRVIPGNRMDTVSPRLVSAADIILIQRDFPRLQKAYSEILQRARQAGKPLVYDLDDLLLDMPENHPDRQSGYYEGAHLPMMQAMLDADLVTASTSPLCKALAEFNQQVVLLPNYLNESLWSLRPPRGGVAPHSPSDGKRIVIGYIGSSTHTGDLAQIAPALRQVLMRFPGKVQLKFWGLPPPDLLRDAPGVDWQPLGIYHYAQYAAYVIGLECDIVIAPMQDTRFNRCKSAIKFLEYSAMGMPGVYSRIHPYASVIEHGSNGLLAASLEEWEQALCQLVEDAALRHRIASQAQESLREHWLLSQHAHEWQDVYERLSGPSARRRSPSGLAWEQAMIRLRMTLTPPGSLRERAIRLPGRVVQILSTEGQRGLTKRLRENLGMPVSGAPSSALLSMPSPKQDRTQAAGSLHTLASLPVDEGLLPPTPKASLILLTYNNLNYTRLCLNSIYRATQHPDFEVIVVDNASQDGTPAFLQAYAAGHDNMNLVLNSDNLGFARGNNLGAKAASGDVIVFLNNDTVVPSGWLSALLRYLHSPRVGMVGPLTNSSGNESRIPVDYHNLGEMEQFARAYTQAHAGQAFEIRMLAFMCVALRRTVYDEIGPLDEQFGLGTFEDDDYALRVKARGYQILCAQDAFVHHWGSASFSRLSDRRFFRIYNQNLRRFEQKWGMRWQP